MLRRNMLLAGSAAILSTTMLSACSSGTGLPPAQILADVQAAVQKLQDTITQLQATTPPTITQALATTLSLDIQQAQAFLTAMGAATGSAATTLLGRVEGYFNSALAGLSAIVLPAPFNLVFLAASIVAQELESYLNTIVPGPASPVVGASALKAQKFGMTLERARVVLGSHT